MGIFDGDMAILSFKILWKRHVFFENSLGTKGLNNYPKFIILSHYGLKWDNISVFVEKTPKIRKKREYVCLINPLVPNVPIWEHF